MRNLRRMMLLAIALGAMACTDATDDVASTTTTESRPTAGVTVDPPPTAATEIDCEAMSDPLFELAFSNQFLAGLDSNGAFELITSGTVDVDFAEIRRSVAVLRPLDQVDPNPLGSVDDSLDLIDRAAALAGVAAEAADPASTDAFTELQTVIADDEAFIGSIGAVNFAFGEAGCFE